MRSRFDDREDRGDRSPLVSGLERRERVAEPAAQRLAHDLVQRQLAVEAPAWSVDALIERFDHGEGELWWEMSNAIDDRDLWRKWKEGQIDLAMQEHAKRLDAADPCNEMFICLFYK